MDERGMDERELATLREQLTQCQSEMKARQAEHERTQKIQAALYRIATAASAAQDIQAFYAEMHEILRELMYAESCYIATYDARTNLVSYPYWVDLAGDEQPPPEILGTRKTAIAWVIQHGETIDDPSGKVAEVMARGEMDLHGTESNGIAVPLISTGKTLGALLVQSYDPEVTYSPQDVYLLSFVAQHIASALNRLMAIEETRQRNAELAIINTVQRSLASELDIRGIYEAVGEKLNEIFGFQTVAIYSANLKTRIITSEYSLEKGQKFEPMSMPINSLYEHVIGFDKTFVKNGDFPSFAADFEDYKVPQGEMPKSLVVVPVTRSKDGDLVVVLALMDIDNERAFSNSDIRLLETLANAMSVSLENARLFAETQRLLKETEDRAAELTPACSLRPNVC